MTTYVPHQLCPIFLGSDLYIYSSEATPTNLSCWSVRLYDCNVSTPRVLYLFNSPLLICITVIAFSPITRNYVIHFLKSK